MRNEFVIFSIISTLGVLALAWFVSMGWLWVFLFLGPILLLGFYDFFQTKKAIARNFPLLGRTRYIAEWLRPKIYQYFIESDTDGKPFSRLSRNIIYQRAKGDLDTSPFGTQLDVYSDGFEWMNHSIGALDFHTLDHDPRVKVGGKDCLQPYSSSTLNVSAMSFGSLSSRAILALNGGAKLGDFAHNTGEGGISPFHLEPGGDLIYQIGTGYFGSRASDGNFSAEYFAERCKSPNVKMIEIKLSQGAKPGHGGILPARKVTKQIAEIRNVEMGKDVLSPPYHKAFNTPIGLLNFVKLCRDASGGKPIGFKLCIGQKSEFVAICKAMIETGIRPDFISVDGGEGGTGAAPLEFSNNVGMPFLDGLAFAYDTLIGFNLKKEITLFASGKIATGFDIFRAISMGADACNSARAMMMAVGCIQALECNRNTCPTGVATQDPELVKGLNVEDKEKRVARYHKETIKSFVELMGAAGINHPNEINRIHVSRRISQNEVRRLDEIYPYLVEGCLLNSKSTPKEWKSILGMSDPNSFKTKYDVVFIEED